MNIVNGNTVQREDEYTKARVKELSIVVNLLINSPVITD